MAAKETRPRTSNPKTKPIANINQATYLQAFFIFSLYIVLPMLLLVGILAFDISSTEADPKLEIHSITMRTWETDYLDINFTFINPNKDREIIGENLVFSVFHEKELFLEGTMRPLIRLGPGEKMLIEESIDIEASGYEDYPVVLGDGNYSVKIDGWLKYAPGKFWKRNSSVKVQFNNVRVEYFPPKKDATVESLPPDSEVETTLTEERLQALQELRRRTRGPKRCYGACLSQGWSELNDT